MSRAKHVPYDLALMAFPCGKCAAIAGVWCKRPNGSWSSDLHSDRYRSLRAAEKETPL